MPNRTYNRKQIVNLLREIEADIANGIPTALAAREAGISEETYYLNPS